MTQEQEQILEMVTHAIGAGLAYFMAITLALTVTYFGVKSIYLTYKDYLRKKGIQK